MDEKPDLVDREGDRWTWNPAYQGYECRSLYGYSREDIERCYGPVRVNGETPDVRVLLAEALEDVARKLRRGY
ncbi:hypothetical protein ACFQ8W_00270 [Streptomyces sp. NPDC056508]|uniref:hypothetical protein n=1 Tax=Streptomyces sp. NPDC056508 TaxID=3345845 RepID=UPI0036AB4923